MNRGKVEPMVRVYNRPGQAMARGLEADLPVTVKPAKDQSDGKVLPSGKNNCLTVSTWNPGTEKSDNRQGGT